jgi:phage portal protein BeeE
VSIYVAPRPKAMLGAGAAALTTGPMAPWVSTSYLGREQKFMKQCTALWKGNPWIRAAERVISGKFSTVDWHLEDGNDEAIDDAYPDKRYLVPRDLIERPQRFLTTDLSQGLSRREMWNLTSRHMGVTGNAFWYLDELESTARTPRSILYIAPWRMWPVPDSNGNLIAWMLDYNEHAKTGTRLELDEVIHFTLEPPEEGFFGIGLVESAMKLAALDASTMTHATTTLTGGGRLAGIVSPKDSANPIPDDKFAQIVRDLRTVAEMPDAAKRMTILQGAVDFTPTSANMSELGVTDLLPLGRDFILEVWGVPLSQIGGSTPAGLNGGDIRKYDEAALWQNAIHPRLVALDEGVQYGLLDRYEQLGITVELEIEEPAFDDDGPRYDLLTKSAGIAMTNQERRALINLEPFGNPSIDNAVWLPTLVIEAFIAPDENGVMPPSIIPPPPEPPPNPFAVVNPMVSMAPQLPPGSKAKMTPAQAKLHGSLTALRKRTNREYTASLKSSLAQFLGDQKRDIATNLRMNAEHITRKPRETSVWFKDARWDRELLSILERPLVTLAQGVQDRIGTVLPQAKAAPAGTVERALSRGAARVKGINARTKDAVKDFIVKGLDDGLSPAELADMIEAGVLLDNGAPAFDEYRAEVIARTELMDAYNGAALGTYTDVGLTEVQAIDGDGDEECAARDGEVFSIEEADGIEDHPNGTLDWVPVLAEPEGKALSESQLRGLELVESMTREAGKADERLAAMVTSMNTRAEAESKRPIIVGAPVVNIPPTVVNVEAPIVHLPAPIVNIPPAPLQRLVRTIVEHDENGEPVGSRQEFAE